MAPIFVSHSHQDSEYCQAFVDALRKVKSVDVAGQSEPLDIWYDKSNLGAGSIPEGVESALEACDYFIVILSPASLDSKWVTREIGAAYDMEGRGKIKALLPVVAKPCRIPPLLSTYLRVEEGHSPDEAAELAYHNLFVASHHSPASEPTLKVVRQPDDPDLDQFFALYQRLIGNADERSSQDDMLRYIEESQSERLKERPEYLEELVLVKIGREVAAFCNYTFYYSSRFVFVSYIGKDKKSGIAPGDAALELMLNHFKMTMTDVKCRGVIFEVESNRRSEDREAARIRTFRRYLTHIAHLVDTRCYEIDFQFIQPHIMIEDVPESAGRFHELMARIHSPHDSLQNLGIPGLSLGYIPLPPETTNGSVIPKEKLLDILRFVYLQVYGDSYIDNKHNDMKYKAYMQRLLRYYELTLKREVPFKPGWE